MAERKVTKEVVEIGADGRHRRVKCTMTVQQATPEQQKALDALKVPSDAAVDVVASAYRDVGIPYNIVREQETEMTEAEIRQYNTAQGVAQARTTAVPPGERTVADRGGEDKLTRAAAAGVGGLSPQGPQNPAPGTLGAKPEQPGVNPGRNPVADGSTRTEDPTKAPQAQGLSSGSEGSNPSHR